MHFMYNLMYNLMYFDVQTAGVHWCQCSLGRSGAARRRARFARHIFKKLLLEEGEYVGQGEDIGQGESIGQE